MNEYDDVERQGGKRLIDVIRLFSATTSRSACALGKVKT